MPAYALLLAASAGVRAASLNLCTDEYLLLLAAPKQIVGVSYLSREPLESKLWKAARGYPGNRGSIENVLTLKPDLVLTMGGGGRATALIGRRLHLRVIDLPIPSTLDDVRKNLRSVAEALGNPSAADVWVNRLERLQQSRPRRAADAIWLSAGGQSLAPSSLGAEWLRLAGLQQRPLPGGRATLETLLTFPPNVLVESNYRSRQMSGGVRWLEHPIVRGARSKQVATDGRPWTCMGPLMIPEIDRLRRAAA
jgi:iron complex transport system substrate-binding protein